MTMVLVDPTLCNALADKRVCFGHSYVDDYTKVARVEGTVVATWGSVRQFDVARILLSEQPELELWEFIDEMQERLGKDGMDGGLLFARHGLAWAIDEDWSALPIQKPMAFGSGGEAGQALLDAGLDYESIFRVVAANNYTCCATFDLEAY